MGTISFRCDYLRRLNEPEYKIRFNEIAQGRFGNARR